MATPLLLALWAVTAAGQGNLLAGHGPGLDGRLTDGEVAYDGDEWLGPKAVLLPPGAAWQWDLGASQPLLGVALQADNNDVYVVAASEDGASFAPLFRAEPTGGSGLRARFGAVSGRGRYLRLTAEGGDGRYSVSEVQVFSDDAELSRSPLLRSPWLPRVPLERTWAFLLLAAVVALAAVGARSPRWLAWAAGSALAVGASWVLWQTYHDVRLDADRLSWIRLMVAALAGAAVLRELLFPTRRPAHRGLVLGVLAFAGVIGVLCFANLGRPQFFDGGKGRPTFLHFYDMRTYYPIARYFPELRFDGVYAAGVAVVAEERGGTASLAAQTLRNLRTHEIETVARSEAYVREVRARFSPDRWASFVADTAYFRRGMGDGGFLGSMQDHGGNATPVWFLGARLLMGGIAASDLALWVGVAADVLLLLAAFAALGWAYGPRTALMAMVVFGAIDFYMFGTNWFGAALRHDWLALWCLGLAMLKKDRAVLAGGFFAWAALIRAFPALTFVTLCAPVAWSLATQLWAQRRRFSPRAFLGEQRTFLRVLLGAAVIGGALFLASVAMFGPGAWVEWWRKVAMLNSAGHVNNIALRTYVVVTKSGFMVAAVLLTLFTLFSARRATLDEAAACGTALVGVVFNPANYYLHCIFLLVVLGREREKSRTGALVWLTLLALCSGCYWAALTGELGEHFRRETYVLLWSSGVVLLFQLARSFGSRPEGNRPTMAS